MNSTNSIGKIDAECLILSASKRTLDACVNELTNHVPDVIKTVVQNTQKHNEVFRDDLLCFVSFQSVYWKKLRSPSQEVVNQTTTTTTTTTTTLPGIANYLVLGYINGVQIWRLEFPKNASPPISSSTTSIPSTERITGFRTLYPVACAQLIPDVPCNSSSQQPSCRLAVVQHRDGCYAVDIFSASAGTNVHVIQNPWPVVRLDSALSWSRIENGKWIGTLVVATTQQIRIYDTSTFELRFTISDFQSVSLPPLWRWLASDNVDCPSLIQFTHQHHADASTDCPPKARSSGPTFAVGSRWIVYQSTPTQPQYMQEKVTVEENDVSDDGHRSWITPAAAAWKKLKSSPALLRLSRYPKALDLLLDQAGAAGSLFPVVEASHLDSRWNVASLDLSSSSVPQNVQPDGGLLVIVDLVTSQVVGHICIQSSGYGLKPSDVGLRQDLEKIRGSSTERSFVSVPEFDNVSISEMRDGAWWLSHLDFNSNSLLGKVKTSPGSSSAKPAPLISYMSFDSSGTTLYCSEWTGRTTWVCRFTTRVLNHELVTDGVPIYILQRGCTVGSVIDVTTSNNLFGESIVIIASSRGSGHCFSLPMGFHQSQFDRSCLSLLFPLTLHSTIPSTHRRNTNLHHSMSTEQELNQELSPYSDSDEENERDGTISSESKTSSATVIETTPPRLSLRPCAVSFIHGQQLPLLRSVCRIRLVASSTKLEESNFYWKVIFLPSPFFRPSPKFHPRPSSWGFRRSFRIPWASSSRQYPHRNSHQSVDTSQHQLQHINIKCNFEEIFLLPFLIASSDGVMDFCHAEFAELGAKEHNDDTFDNDVITKAATELQTYPELPSLVPSRSSEICVLADDQAISINGTTSLTHLLSSSETTQKTQLQNSPTMMTSLVPTSFKGSKNLHFVKTRIVHSLSTRDMGIIRCDPNFSTKSSSFSNKNTLSTNNTSGSGFVWARHCEASTVPHKELLFRVKFINYHDESQKTTDGLDLKQSAAILNQLFRSGDSLHQLFVSSQMDYDSLRLRSAIDAALNAPIQTFQNSSSSSSKLGNEVPSMHLSPNVQSNGSVGLWPPKQDDYVLYQY